MVSTLVAAAYQAPARRMPAGSLSRDVNLKLPLNRLPLQVMYAS